MPKHNGLRFGILRYSENDIPRLTCDVCTAYFDKEAHNDANRVHKGNDCAPCPVCQPNVTFPIDGMQTVQIKLSIGQYKFKDPKWERKMKRRYGVIPN